MNVVGLMSGTSYDGVDVAAADLTLRGDVLRLQPLGALSIDLDAELRESLAAALPPQTITGGAVCRLDTLLGQTFATAAARGIDELCVGRADLIVSHGQTIYHWVEDGKARGTLQLGDPAWIAERTGLPVISQLRSRDIACGGQGAPLVSTFDVLLLSSKSVTRAALNLGGIANLTVIRPDGPALAYDIGPGNALIDAATQSLFGEPCDRDGHHGERGTVQADLLRALLDEPYFAAPPPKSTGKELFHWDFVERRLGSTGQVSPDDIVATLTELTARLVTQECIAQQVSEVVASGGGTHNPHLMRRIVALAKGQLSLREVDELGLPSESKEAYAFAVLGYLTLHGLSGTVPTCTGARRAAILGNITPGTDLLRFPESPSSALQRIEIVLP